MLILSNNSNWSSCTVTTTYDIPDTRQAAPTTRTAGYMELQPVNTPIDGAVTSIIIPVGRTEGYTSLDIAQPSVYEDLTLQQGKVTVIPSAYKIL